MIGLVAVTAAGRSSADRLAAAWPGRTKHYCGTAATALPTAFAECEAIVAFLATGATVRLLAPLLAAKATDPAVVCVDQGRRFAVALLGGHQGGANRLAVDVAEVLGAEPVVTTATDATGLPGLDDVGLPVAGDVAGVARAMLDGEPVRLVMQRPWPLPAFPRNVRMDEPTAQEAAAIADEAGAQEPNVGELAVVVTDQVTPARPGLVVLHPPCLVLGVGASRGADATELSELADRTLTAAGLAPAAVGGIVTIDGKASEPAVLALAERLGVEIRAFPAEVLAVQPVPHPSEVVRAAVGTPSVAEAAVLAAGANLVAGKVASTASTVAVGRYPVRGRLAVVGIGPGARDLLTPRAVAELRAASVVVGLGSYLEQIADLLRPGTTVLASRMGSERERAETAVRHAQAGRAVAIVGSGDAGVYAMASPVLEVLAGSVAAGGAPVDVVGVPGVTAALAASSLLGAPLGNDHAYISLSDLHTPWEVIERRLVAAASGDFTVALYNPRSLGRRDHLRRALEILSAGRPPDTPVGVVRNACRPEESVEVTTIADLDVEAVDMLTVVIVGASDARILDGHMVTPRGYRWMA